MIRRFPSTRTAPSFYDPVPARKTELLGLLKLLLDETEGNLEAARYLLPWQIIQPGGKQDVSLTRRQLLQNGLQHPQIGARFGSARWIGRIVGNVEQTIDFGRAQMAVVYVAHPVARRVHGDAKNVVAWIANAFERVDAGNLEPRILQRITGQFGGTEPRRQPMLDVIVSVDQETPNNCQ